MARKALVFAIVVLLISGAYGGEQPPLSPGIQQQLTAKYPNQKLVNWCSGKFVGKDTNAIAVLRDESKKQFLVLWVMPPGGIQELASVAQFDTSNEFDMQCLNAKEAKEVEYTSQHSETIHSDMKVLKGLGAVCYFIDNTTSDCWSLHRSSGKLVKIGGWLT